MDRAISSDDLRVGVKGLTSSGIAGSPRNMFGHSVKSWNFAVEHWKEYLEFSQVFLPNSECKVSDLGSQTSGDKVRGQKGNNPNLNLRSLNLG